MISGIFTSKADIKKMYLSGAVFSMKEFDPGQSTVRKTQMN